MKTHRRKNFTIRFYEGVVQDRPFFEALVCLGNAYTENGFYEEGLKIDTMLSQLHPCDPLVHYNIACSHALLKNIDQSLRHLTKSFVFGYDDIQYMLQDKDLDNLKKDDRFQGFLQKVSRPVRVCEAV